MKLWLASVVCLWAACDCQATQSGGGSCVTSADCLGAGVCIDGTCRNAAADGSLSDGTRPDGSISPDGCAAPCGSNCCAPGEVCSENQCLPDLGACSTSDECREDTSCRDGRCVPFGPPGPDRDPECSRVIAAGTFQPTIQCEFAEVPPGDPFPGHLHVLSTPVVVDFRIDRGPDDPASPSIVAVFDDGEDGGVELPTGVIRILDGETCQQQAELGSLQLTSHSSPPAVGDIDGDGQAEIVAFQAGGGVVAYDYSAGRWQVAWRSNTSPTGSGWAGPSIYDLDNDGVPEILRSGIVFSNTGQQLDGALGNFPGGNTTGVFAVVADVDGDGLAEQVQGHGVWQWNTATNTWTPETWSPGGNEPGHVGLGDFGAFAGNMGWPDTAPEVVVISPGTMRVQTLDGVTVFGPVGIPGGGLGGPPTIADFDGDGRAEFATAGASNYVVADLDCGAAPIGACASGRADGILWSARSQDQSSNRTGSSVFDFEGDGRAEVVYGDECFLRVYDGESGDVVFSQARTSCTWYENPVVADVDGDFNAEIVIGNNFNCPEEGHPEGRNCTPFGLDARNTDPLFAGLRCAEPTDCLSGNCVEGLCRCVADTECCQGAGCDRSPFVCEPPPAGTPGAGNTCRASRPGGVRGIRVYADSADRWVRSRIIWNQHVYHVTNVNDDGTIPSTSAAAINWTTRGLNNFRANVQGDALPGAAPDLTAARTPVICDASGTAMLEARVCNRGTEPVGAGMTVGFYEGEPSEASLLCRSSVDVVLNPGMCEVARCEWMDGPNMPPGVDVTVVADDTNQNGECYEANNQTTLPGVFCSIVM